MTVGLLLSLSLPAAATTLYVDVNNPAPAAPYTNWVTAATSIQAAVDAAVDGDEIVVTNGVYQSGGRIVYGSMKNRVAVTKASDRAERQWGCCHCNPRLSGAWPRQWRQRGALCLSDQ